MKQNRNYILFFISIVFLSLLSFASFWRGLSFYFFQDDYQFLWNGLYHPLFFITFRHPSTPLESFFLGPLFGLNALYWELLGIGLKVCVACLLGVFMYKITQSKLTGVLSAVFFSVSYAGMYVVNTFNYDAPILATIALLLSLTYFLTGILENKKKIWISIVLLLLAISLDPARILPVFLIIPWFFFLFPKSKNSIYMKNFFKKFLTALLVVGLPIFLFWYFVVSKGAGTQFEIFLRGMVTNPRYMITKTKDIGNFAATMTNLFTDTIYGLQLEAPKYEVAYYNRIFGIAGVGIFIAGACSFVYFLKKKKKEFGIISFFIFWTYIFYLPNFLAEPRAPMSSINHYLFISSIGSVSLLAYLISLVKKRWLLIILSITFVCLNIYKANSMLSEQYPFRSAVLIEKAWQTIVSTAPKKQTNDLFFFTGNTYWADYSFLSFGSYHYLLSEKDGNIQDFPYLITDERYAMSLVCAQQKGSAVKQVPLSHVNAWKVISPGVLVNNTPEQREKFRAEARGWQCSISE